MPVADVSAPPRNPLLGVLADAAGKPNGQAIYDYLMAKIEPDLVTAAMATLEKKYAGETDKQRTARNARYQAAFAEYDRTYAALLAQAKQQMHAFEHGVAKVTEHISRVDEGTDMQSLESAMASA